MNQMFMISFDQSKVAPFSGDPRVLYDSVHQQILSLPMDYLLYPAHDYKGITCIDCFYVNFPFCNFPIKL